MNYSEFYKKYVSMVKDDNSHQNKDSIGNTDPRLGVRDWQNLYSILHTKETYDSFVDNMDRANQEDKYASFSEMFAKKSITKKSDN